MLFQHHNIISDKVTVCLYQILARDRKILLGVRVRGRADRISLDPSRVVTAMDEMIYVHIL